MRIFSTYRPQVHEFFCRLGGTKIECTRPLCYKSYKTSIYTSKFSNETLFAYLYLDIFISLIYSSQEASSSRSRNPLWVVFWTVGNLGWHPQVDAASNLVHNSFFKVFSPGSFPVWNDLSGIGVLSTCDKLPTKWSA